MSMKTGSGPRREISRAPGRKVAPGSPPPEAPDLAAGGQARRVRHGVAPPSRCVGLPLGNALNRYASGRYDIWPDPGDPLGARGRPGSDVHPALPSGPGSDRLWVSPALRALRAV
jgi:hypothetical protein